MTVDTWTEARLALLRQLWAEGLSTLLIAERLRLSKNAVVGKAHRIGLQPRPSPIQARPDGPARPKPVPRVRKVASLPPLASVAAVEPPPPPPPPPVRVRAALPCSYPIGEPRTRAFRYCDAPAEPGKSYCAEHAALCLVPAKGRAA